MKCALPNVCGEYQPMVDAAADHYEFVIHRCYIVATSADVAACDPCLELACRTDERGGITPSLNASLAARRRGVSLRNQISFDRVVPAEFTKEGTR